MDSNFLETDLLSPVVRGQLAHTTGKLFQLLWRATPKRAISLYGSAIVGATLVFLPVERGYYSDDGMGHRWPPALGLTMTSLGLTLIGAAHAGLKKFQNELDETEDDHQFQKQLQRQAFQDSEISRIYTAVSEVKLQNNASLPDHMKEPGLVPPKTQQEEMAEFKALMGLADAEETTEQSASKTKGFLKGTIDGFDYFTRKNATTKATEQCVKLEGKRKWCGVPIENPIPRFLADDRGLLGLGTTGVGKSAFLEAIVSHAYQVNELTDFVAIAHKSGNAARGEKLTMAGLENTQDMYVLTRTMQGQTLIDAATRLRLRVGALENLLETGSLVPSFVLIDEGNEGTKAMTKAAREYGTMTAEPDKKPIIPTWQEDYSDFIETLIVDGRSKGVRGVVFGHLSTNKSGISKEVRNQNYAIALGRNGIYGSIETLLTDARYITMKETREALKQEFSAYLEQHQAKSSPVNVVLALTNIGGQWRLIVLPQDWNIQSITPNVVNPPLHEPYGFESDSSPELQPVASPMPVDATQQTDPLACYSPDQKRLAHDFLSWYDSQADVLEDSTGLLDLRVPLQCWPQAQSLSQLEMILEVLAIQGYGEFHYDKIDRALFWRFHPRNGRGKLQPQIVQKQPVDVNALDIPEGITVEAFRCVVGKLFELQLGSVHTVSDFNRSLGALRSSHGLKVADVHRLLSSESLKKVIVLDPGKYHSKLQFKVVWLPPHA